MVDTSDLLESVREGRAGSLDADQISELIAWLGGGRNEFTSEPGQDPVLHQMVLFRLDAALFRDGKLDLRAAGVSAEISARDRRVRFRKLASAFHPDRFPALADWLTIRSQAVHTAYAAFKKDPNDDSSGILPHQVWSEGPQADFSRAPRYPNRPTGLRAVMVRLRAKFGHDRFLAHKFIAGLAVIALLPTLNLLLAPALEIDRSERVQIDDRPSALMDSSFQATTAVGRVEPVESTAGDLRGSGSMQDRNDISDRSGKDMQGSLRMPQDPTDGIDPVSERTDGRAISDSASGEQLVHLDAMGSVSVDRSEGQSEEFPPVSTDEGQVAQAARNAIGSNPSLSIPSGSVDQQLAALGLPTDDERLNQRFDSTSKSDSSESWSTRPGRRGGSAIGGRTGQNEESAQSERLALDDRNERRSRLNEMDQQELENDDGRESAPAAENQASRVPVRQSGPIAREGEPPSLLEEAGITERQEQWTGRLSGLAAAEPGQQVAVRSSDDVNSVSDVTAVDVVSPEDDVDSLSIPEGRLTLGPLGVHPTGDVLTAFKSNLEGGDVLALRALFLNQRVGDSFVEFIEKTEARAIDLHVHGLQREEHGWRIEADLTMKTASNASAYPGTVFLLSERNRALRIADVIR